MVFDNVKERPIAHGWAAGEYCSVLSQGSPARLDATIHLGGNNALIETAIAVALHLKSKTLELLNAILTIVLFFATL